MVFFGIIKRPDNSEALKRASAIGERLLFVYYAICKMANLILRSLSERLLALPYDVILLSFGAALGLMLTVSVIKPYLTRCVLVVEKSLFLS